MTRPQYALTVMLVGMMLLDSSAVLGQPYPNKPVRIFAGSIGGAGDIVARLIAEGISAPLGQPVIVENRPTNVGPELVFKAPPDGYTLLVAGATFMFGPLLVRTPYDPLQ